MLANGIGPLTIARDLDHSNANTNLNNLCLKLTINTPGAQYLTSTLIAPRDYLYAYGASPLV